MENRIAKCLSANDTGETGGHQAGILIPREERALSFFPKLDPSLRNPRCHLRFLDDAGTLWTFAFIYYNNRHFGGTRNEYRLTRMTTFIRQAGLVEGDEITLSRDSSRYFITYRRIAKSPMRRGTLRLGTGWRVISIE